MGQTGGGSKALVLRHSMVGRIMIGVLKSTTLLHLRQLRGSKYCCCHFHLCLVDPHQTHLTRHPCPCPLFHQNHHYPTVAGQCSCWLAPWPLLSFTVVVLLSLFPKSKWHKITPLMTFPKMDASRYLDVSASMQLDNLGRKAPIDSSSSSNQHASPSPG